MTPGRFIHQDTAAEERLCALPYCLHREPQALLALEAGTVLRLGEISFWLQ